MPDQHTEERVKQGTIHSLRTWGGLHSNPAVSSDAHSRIENPLPPTLLATLITAQHMRPFQPLPMIFPPILLFSSYLNINSYKIDAAGITAAWSGLYLLLASRRKQVSLSNIFESCLATTLRCSHWVNHT